MQEWAQARSAESLAIGRAYLDGRGPFPQRLPQLELTSRFLTDFYALVGDWARWAGHIVETWPDEPGQAQPDLTVIEETVRRAAATGESDTQLHIQQTDTS
jgi:PadR family transcriptional regulator AphA